MVPEGKVKVKVLSPFQRAAKKRDRTLLGARAVRHPSGVPHRARGKAAELLRPAVVCLFLQPPDCASVHRRARGLLDPLRLHKAPPHASGHQPSPWPSSCTGQGEDQASRWRLAAAGGRSLLGQHRGCCSRDSNYRKPRCTKMETGRPAHPNSDVCREKVQWSGELGASLIPGLFPSRGPMSDPRSWDSEDAGRLAKTAEVQRSPPHACPGPRRYLFCL